MALNIKKKKGNSNPKIIHATTLMRITAVLSRGKMNIAGLRDAGP